MSEVLHIPTQSSEGFFKDRGSKFYSFAYYVDSLEEIEEKLNILRKQFHDARHHCYAYRLGTDGKISFANDDREPAHSAGDPILAAIRAHALTNVLVVVVRYFGGTKLGIRGLIEAYRQAAEEAIQTNIRQEIIPRIQFSIVYPYEKTSEVRKILHVFDVDLVEESYTDICKQSFNIREENYEALKKPFEDAGYILQDIKKIYW